jgi:riboflavin biosynthesis pyrimidine reductase
MMSTIDGRIDGEALRSLGELDDYEVTGEQPEGDAWICGRTTMQQHFADDEPFVSKTNRAAGPQPVHVARRSDSYAISVDTTGKLKWSSSEIDGDHIICIVSERAADDYLSMLRNVGVSYIVAGSREVDLANALDLLHEHFGIRKLLLEGGGHINGGFVEAGLVDEVTIEVWLDETDKANAIVRSRPRPRPKKKKARSIRAGFFFLQGYAPTAFIMSKIGRYIAMIIPPTTIPRNTIMIGSIAASNASTAASTSSS